MQGKEIKEKQRKGTESRDGMMKDTIVLKGREKKGKEKKQVQLKWKRAEDEWRAEQRAGDHRAKPSFLRGGAGLF